MTTRKLTLVPSAIPSPLVVLVDDFLADQRAKGNSPKTLKYGLGWPLKEIFLPWCADTGITTVEQLTSRVCNDFSTHLHEHGGKKGPLKPASIWTYSKAVRRFIAWAAAQGEQVPGTVKLNKLPQVMLEILSTKEIAQLEDTATSERDKLIIRVLADTGMRREELVKITKRDVIEEHGKSYIVVHGKGGKDRKVPVTPSLARRLRKYIAGRPKDVDSTQVFLALKRRGDGTLRAITPSGITQMVVALGERAGLDKEVHPHTLRHSFITEMRRRHMDPILVAQIVGHTSLQMIMRVYDHMTPSDASDALLKALAAED